jgi:MFS family permease
VTVALGLVWIFDGYEVTLISLYRKEIVASSSESTFKSLVSAYQIGGMVGSLLFGVMAFVIGRRKIFMVSIS